MQPNITIRENPGEGVPASKVVVKLFFHTLRRVCQRKKTQDEAEKNFF